MPVTSSPRTVTRENRKWHLPKIISPCRRDEPNWYNNVSSTTNGYKRAPNLQKQKNALGEGQYFFYVDVFDGVLTQAVCLDKPVTEFAFEVTSGDLTMPEWAPGWGRIHFPPVKVLENGYDG